MTMDLRAAGAVAGVAVAAFVVAGVAGFEPALRFAQEPIGWATVLALLVRLAVPATASRH